MSGIAWIVVGACLLLLGTNLLILSRRLDNHKATAARTYHDLASRVTQMEHPE